MCLFLRQETTAELQEKRSFVAWKVGYMRAGRLLSRFRGVTYVPGENRERFPLTAEFAASCVDGDELGRGGLHVFLSRERAQRFMDEGDIALPVTVFGADVIAAGDYEWLGDNATAMVKKMYISPTVWEMYVGRTA